MESTRTSRGPALAAALLGSLALACGSSEGDDTFGPDPVGDPLALVVEPLAGQVPYLAQALPEDGVLAAFETSLRTFRPGSDAAVAGAAGRVVAARALARPSW